ncbi:MAG: hypothetical protein NT004_15325 [Bacteroidetes bacterium]|nr:hypothetical protein [Bacteroidota bacterium]
MTQIDEKVCGILIFIIRAVSIAPKVTANQIAKLPYISDVTKYFNFAGLKPL